MFQACQPETGQESAKPTHVPNPGHVLIRDVLPRDTIVHGRMTYIMTVVGQLALHGHAVAPASTCSSGCKTPWSNLAVESR